MVKISAVVITKNEEKNIAQCLQSLKNVVDEIVVVDSLSTDSTEAICLSFGVRYIKQEWLGYGQQKNFGNIKASYDYILSLDADEVLSPELQKAILEIKSGWAHDAYSFNRLNMYCGYPIKHCGWYPDKKIRLWDRRKGEWDSAEVHEQLQLSSSATVMHLNCDIIHYTYRSVADHVARIPGYSNLWVEKAVKRNKKVSFVKLLITSSWRFFQSYILRLGFLDGYNGLMVCAISAYSACQNYSKLYYYRQTRKNISYTAPASQHSEDSRQFPVYVSVTDRAKLALCLKGLQDNSSFKHEIILKGNVNGLEQLRTAYPLLDIRLAEGTEEKAEGFTVCMNDSLFVSERWDYLLCKETGLV